MSLKRNLLLALLLVTGGALLLSSFFSLPLELTLLGVAGLGLSLYLAVRAPELFLVADSAKRPRRRRPCQVSSTQAIPFHPNSSIPLSLTQFCPSQLLSSPPAPCTRPHHVIDFCQRPPQVCPS